jgi:hypothetical protein
VFQKHAQCLGQFEVAHLCFPPQAGDLIFANLVPKCALNSDHGSKSSSNQGGSVPILLSCLPLGSLAVWDTALVETYEKFENFRVDYFLPLDMGLFQKPSPGDLHAISSPKFKMQTKL